MTLKEKEKGNVQKKGMAICYIMNRCLVISNTKQKAPSNWQFTCQLTHIYENFKEKYFRSIHSTSWLFETSESDSYDKNDMKEKVNDLVRLRKTMQEKLKTASYSEQIQILSLVPDKWCRIYCSVFLISLNTLFELHMKSKNQVEY